MRHDGSLGEFLDRELYSSAKLSIQEQAQELYRNVQRFRGRLIFKAHIICVSLNSRIASNKEEEERIAKPGPEFGPEFSISKVKVVKNS